ncbi:hypothetical protein HDV05_003784 [Chytridiales sp. JEL 0842]|nr:hypothetical protein HDV05_003784 [Chytridiales sp. JEL 0842]
MALPYSPQQQHRGSGGYSYPPPPNTYPSAAHHPANGYDNSNTSSYQVPPTPTNTMPPTLPPPSSITTRIPTGQWFYSPSAPSWYPKGGSSPSSNALYPRQEETEKRPTLPLVNATIPKSSSYPSIPYNSYDQQRQSHNEQSRFPGSSSPPSSSTSSTSYAAQTSYSTSFKNEHSYAHGDTYSPPSHQPSHPPFAPYHSAPTISAPPPPMGPHGVSSKASPPANTAQSPQATAPPRISTSPPKEVPSSQPSPAVSPPSASSPAPSQRQPKSNKRLRNIHPAPSSKASHQTRSSPSSTPATETKRVQTPPYDAGMYVPVPAEYEILCSEREFVVPSGVVLRAKVWGVDPKGQQSAEISMEEMGARCVLALHGWLDNANTWDLVAPRLALAGLYVVCLDLAGHGHSDHRNPQGGYYLWDMIDDVLGVVESLSWSYFTFLGHSTGGHISSVFAGVYPSKVRAVCMVDSIGTSIQFCADAGTEMAAFIQRRREVNKFGRTRLYESVEEAAMNRRKGFTRMSLDASKVLCERGLEQIETPLVVVEEEKEKGSEGVGPTVVESGIKYLWRTDPRLTLWAYLHCDEGALLSFFSKISCPVLILTAAKSEVFNLENNKWRSRLARFRMLRKQVVVGFHHMHLEKESAEAVVRMIVDFLGWEEGKKAPVEIENQQNESSEPPAQVSTTTLAPGSWKGCIRMGASYPCSEIRLKAGNEQTMDGSPLPYHIENYHHNGPAPPTNLPEASASSRNAQAQTPTMNNPPPAHVLNGLLSAEAAAAAVAAIGNTIQSHKRAQEEEEERRKKLKVDESG